MWETLTFNRLCVRPFTVFLLQSCWFLFVRTFKGHQVILEFPDFPETIKWCL